MQVLLGITRSEYDAAPEMPGYIRVLGFTEKGRSLLADLKKDRSDGTAPEPEETGRDAAPVITNINKERDLISGDALKMLELDLRAADMYNLIAGRSVYGDSDHRRSCIRILRTGEPGAQLRMRNG